MLTLRYYQEEAIASMMDYWAAGGENPLVEICTGGGKSLVMATLAQRLIADYSDLRILIITHVRELIKSNYLELLGVWPWAPAGIYSAGLGRREAHSQIVFAGIQTVHSKARHIGHVDLVMVDEAHLIPRSADTMYGKFLGELAAINPDLKVCGLTATAYRTDSGRLDEGDVRLFDKIVYKYGISDGVKDGFLAPLISPATATNIDLSGVARRGGDYVAGALQAACDKDSITKSAVDEIIAFGENRRSWLQFCAGVEHANHVAEEIRRRGIQCGVVTGDTADGERDRMVEDFKAGKLRALCNNVILTTGTNFPGLDLIANLSGTKSAGRYVQKMGRGTRCFGIDIEESVRNGKADCLALDFGGDIRQHGPVDRVEPRAPGKGDGTPMVKECPQCHHLIHLSYKECPDCGFVFVTEDKPKHEAKAAALPILSTSAPEWVPVTTRKLYYHDKVGGTPSVRAEFFCNYVNYKHWICPGHTGFAKTKADKWWKQHGGQTPFPTDADDFLERVGELRDTTEIQVRPSGKYWEIVGFKVDPVAKQQVALPDSVSAYKHLRTLDTLDDEIPF